MFEKDKHKLDKRQSLDAYKKMLLIRRFEEKSGQLYGMGLIGGFCHLYIGQEAVITAVDLVKERSDSTITSYRDHAHIILAGTDPKYVMAELTGRSSGCSKGKGGSMHMFDTKGKFYGGHGIVGAQVPLGTGLAFAEKYKSTNNICYTFLGDGAVNQGQVHEAFNMAALWRLPVIYIIENNEYSMGTSVARSTALTDLYKKGESFGIEGIRINGMDVEETYNILKQATDYVRSNSIPLIIEAKTYRYRGHSMSDPAKYRTKEELEEYKDKDPIVALKNLIYANSYASEADLKDIDNMVKAIVKEVEEFATSEPLPFESELYTDIYK